MSSTPLAGRSNRGAHLASRRIAVLLIVAWAWTWPVTAQAPGDVFQGVVARVVDGDTLDVRRPGDRQAIRIRLEGIDTPERGEPFASAATRFTRAASFNQAVRVQATDVDRYGRLVARVTVGGVDLSVSLVREGLACVYRRYTRDPVLYRAETEARVARRGFWAVADRPRCVKQAV